MNRYLIVAASVLFAGYAQADPEWGYQCTLDDRSYSDQGTRVQQIDLFPGGAIVKSQSYKTGELGTGGRVYKELENTDRSYEIGMLLNPDTTARQLTADDIMYPVISIDKRTLAYNATVMTAQRSGSSHTQGTCVRLTL
jgi:hypothetical protein